MTTNEFLDAVKNHHKLPSGYALAKFLGRTKSSISQYRTKPQYLDDELAIKVADLLKLDPGYVLSSIHAERAKRPEVKKAWEHVAHMLQRSRRAAAAIFVGFFAFFLSGTPQTSHAAPPDNNATTVYYVKLRRCTINKIALNTLATDRPQAYSDPSGYPLLRPAIRCRSVLNQLKTSPCYTSWNTHCRRVIFCTEFADTTNHCCWVW